MGKAIKKIKEMKEQIKGINEKWQGINKEHTSDLLKMW